MFRRRTDQRAEPGPPAEPLAAGIGRAPVLYPAPLGGLAIASARSRRVEVDGAGRLVVTEDGEVVAVVTDAGDIDKVVHVGPRQSLLMRRWRPDAEHGLVGLLGSGRVRAVLVVDEWVPRRTLEDIPGALAVSGISAVVDRLGLAVEAADTHEARRVARARHRHVSSRSYRLGPDWGRDVVSVICTVLAVVAAGSFVQDLEPDVTVAVAVLTAATLALAPVVWSIVRGRRAFQRIVRSPSTAHGTEIRTQLSSRAGGAAAGRILVDPAHVVINDRGFEQWLPGPAVGGVTQVARSDAAIHLRDRRGRDLVVLDPAIWGRDLDDALREAGVVVQDVPVTTHGRSEFFSAGRREGERGRASYSMEFEDEGGGHVATAPLAQIAAWTILVVAALAATVHASSLVDLVSPLLLLPLVGCVHPVMLTRSWWQRLRWDLSQRSRIPT